jgi:catechol 2,3-dioxygenase-like lactoylglutathione lyase family enzyme
VHIVVDKGRDARFPLGITCSDRQLVATRLRRHFCMMAYKNRLVGRLRPSSGRSAIDQESTSAGHGAAHSLIVMDITIHTSFLPHDDPDASLAFYRDALGFEVRSDVGQGKMRWITVGPVGQPGTSILLAPPAADPGVTEDERRTIVEMMAKGTYGWILLATRDLDGTFEKVQAGDAEVVQEPTEQPYGIRDCAFRDPAGNLVRIQELR